MAKAYTRDCSRCFHFDACDNLTMEGLVLAKNASTCPHYIAAIDPRDFAIEMARLSNTEDLELRHISMDRAMYELLKQLGYDEAVRIFKDTDKWYG